MREGGRYRVREGDGERGRERGKVRKAKTKEKQRKNNKKPPSSNQYSCIKYLSLLRLFFLFQFAAVFVSTAGFQAGGQLVVTDGWWTVVVVVVDGGWWRVEKKVL